MTGEFTRRRWSGCWQVSSPKLHSCYSKADLPNVAEESNSAKHRGLRLAPLDKSARIVHSLFQMSTPCDILAPPTDGLPDAVDAPHPQVARKLAMLDRLATVGLEVALAIEGCAKDVAPTDHAPRDLADLALAYSRAARAVRLTVMLQSRLLSGDDAAGGAGRKRGGGLEDDDDDDDAPIEVVWLNSEKAEALQRRERLERGDITAADLDRPFGETVAEVCRDLGLPPDWPARTQAEIAAGQPGPSWLGFGPNLDPGPTAHAAPAPHGAGDSTLDDFGPGDFGPDSS